MFPMEIIPQIKLQEFEKEFGTVNFSELMVSENIDIIFKAFAENKLWQVVYINNRIEINNIILLNRDTAGYFITEKECKNKMCVLVEKQ